MKTLNIFLLTIFLSALSCNGELKNDQHNLEGNWYYINPKDSSYNELYFSKEFFFYNLGNSITGRVRKYRIEKDDLYTVALNDPNVKHLFFKIISVDEDKASISFEKGSIYHLEKLKLLQSPWNGLVIHEEYENNLQNEMRQRGFLIQEQKGILKYEISEGGDSIDIIEIPN